MGAAVMERVHGLAMRDAPPDWPNLTAAELAPLARAYPAIGPVKRVAWHSPRPFAASGLMQGAHGTVFVKRHNARVRCAADLAEEHAFIAHLRAAGVAVPHVLHTADGATSFAIGDCIYEVHDVAAGRDLYRDAVSWSPFTQAAHAFAAGAALGALHDGAETYTAPKRKTGLLVADFTAFGSADPLAALEHRVARETLLAGALAGRPWQADLRRVLLPWHERLKPLMPALNPLWTHNDLHASNLLWQGDGAAARVSAILDFGLANCTSAAFDLATALERNTIEWLRLEDGQTDIAHPDLARALLGGYRTVRKLPVALPFVLPLVHAEFALSELAYFHGILGSREKSDLAYHEFLLGHADWFRTPPGQRFLQMISDEI